MCVSWMGVTPAHPMLVGTLRVAVRFALARGVGSTSKPASTVAFLPAFLIMYAAGGVGPRETKGVFQTPQRIVVSVCQCFAWRVGLRHSDGSSASWFVCAFLSDWLE